MKTTVHHRKCDACGTRYELLETRSYNADAGAYESPTLHALARGVPDDHLDCPRCKSNRWHPVIGTPALARVHDDPTPYLVRAPDVHETQLSQSHFPYYDHGLGMMLHSVEHREWAKSHYKDGTPREEPLVWVGDQLPFAPTDIVDRELAHTREVEAKYNAYKDEMMSHPDTRRAWDYIERAAAARDFSGLGVEDPEFFGPTHYPPQGEALLQDIESGHLYTESGWQSDHPQKWVPLALEAAGHPPLLPTDPGPALLEDSHAAPAL